MKCICGCNKFRKYGIHKKRVKGDPKNRITIQKYQCIECGRIKKGEILPPVPPSF